MEPKFPLASSSPTPHLAEGTNLGSIFILTTPNINWGILHKFVNLRKFDSQKYVAGEWATFLSSLFPERNTLEVLRNEEALSILNFSFMIEITDNDNLYHRLLKSFCLSGLSVHADKNFLIVSGHLGAIKRLIITLCSKYSDTASKYVGNLLYYELAKQKLDGMFALFIKEDAGNGRFSLVGQ